MTVVNIILVAGFSVEIVPDVELQGNELMREHSRDRTLAIGDHSIA
jgi:hypothetical protein